MSFFFQDSLVANLNEIEKQTEMAARVSTWKQRIEQNLEEEVTPLTVSASVEL